MTTSKAVQIWLVSLVVTVALVLASMRWLDLPIAVYCARYFAGMRPLGDHLGSTMLVAGEALVAFALAIYRIINGRLAVWAKITVIACATSLSAYAFNELVLKTVFGVIPPYDVLTQNLPHGFRFFRGSWQSSLPSGHMALATGFTATFIGQDRRLFFFLVAGTLAAATLLVLGGWHFLSDVIAGAFLGTLTGTMASTLWRRHLAELKV